MNMKTIRLLQNTADILYIHFFFVIFVRENVTNKELSLFPGIIFALRKIFFTVFFFVIRFSLLSLNTCMHLNWREKGKSTITVQREVAFSVFFLSFFLNLVHQQWLHHNMSY